ncbi:MAG: enoyl-CoA hydratase/isomerase family protein [Propionibacteriaceae bacterium]|jgi:enoyl-CoA hydratase|nr:enoyl-CoA hydratase/isomerase family protein [Propionibacteriaceae bacterium]
MSFVRYEWADHVACWTIDREKALNALNSEVLADLSAAADQSLADGTRCVVITGAGPKAFVAGADIAEMAQLTKRQAQAFAELGTGVFRKIERLPIPVVAAVNGFALGGGCELAMACDIRLASTTAVFGQPEVGIGVTPGFGGTQRLPRLVGVGVAKELLYGGRNIKADRALAIGLVNSVHEPDQLLPEALKLARGIAQQAPIAVRAVKAVVGLGLQTDIDSAIALEAAYFGSCFETADQVEGMGSFVEKRKHEPYQDA